MSQDEGMSESPVETLDYRQELLSAHNLFFRVAFTHL